MSECLGDRLEHSINVVLDMSPGWVQRNSFVRITDRVGYNLKYSISTTSQRQRYGNICFKF